MAREVYVQNGRPWVLSMKFVSAFCLCFRDGCETFCVLGDVLAVVRNDGIG
jgi:hypothetical protein